MKPIINTTQSTQKLLELQDRPFPVYIQFGKAKLNKRRGNVTVNPVSGLRNTRNKVSQHILLQEQDIAKPRFMRNRQELTAFLTANPTSCVVAKRVNHSRGRGMYRINGLESLPSVNPVVFDETQYYFEEFVKCNREWRIHVSPLLDEEVTAYRKCLRGEYVEAWRAQETDKPWIRNLETCYYKLDCDGDKKAHYPAMVEECRKALSILGLHIGGVDIGENTKTGQFFIFEVNSACGMEENTRESYANAIEQIIEIKATQKGLI